MAELLRFDNLADAKAEIRKDTFIEWPDDASMRDFEAGVFGPYYDHRVVDNGGVAGGGLDRWSRHQCIKRGIPFGTRGWVTHKSVAAIPHSDGLGGGVLQLVKRRAGRVFNVFQLARLQERFGSDLPNDLDVGDWLLQVARRVERSLNRYEGSSVLMPTRANLDAIADPIIRARLGLGHNVEGTQLPRPRSVLIAQSQQPRKRRAQLSARSKATLAALENE